MLWFGLFLEKTSGDTCFVQQVHNINEYGSIHSLSTWLGLVSLMKQEVRNKSERPKSLMLIGLSISILLFL